MNNEQKQNALEAREAENTKVLIDLTDAQLHVLSELGLDIDEAHKMAASAFNSVLKGKVGSARDKAIKAKYYAMQKNKPALVEECESEIQDAIALYRSLE